MGATAASLEGRGAARATMSAACRASWGLTGVFWVWTVVAVGLQRWDQAFASGILGAGLAVLTQFGGREHGAFEAVIGADRRTSTSKTQTGLWTLVLVWGMGYLLGRHLFQGQSLDTVLPPSFPAQIAP